MGNGDDDPLEGRDIGETVTVRETKEFHTIDFAPDVFYGSDRLSDYDISDVEVVEDEHGDKLVQMTWEGAVTKRLPARWDHHREPVTAEEKRRARRGAWLNKASRFGGLALGVVISVGVGLQVTNKIAGEITVNGQALEPISQTSVLGVFFIIGIMALLVHAAASGVLPRRI